MKKQNNKTGKGIVGIHTYKLEKENNKWWVFVSSEKFKGCWVGMYWSTSKRKAKKVYQGTLLLETYKRGIELNIQKLKEQDEN